MTDDELRALNFFCALEFEKISWWCWSATADDLQAFGPSREIAIARLRAQWLTTLQRRSQH